MDLRQAEKPLYSAHRGEHVPITQPFALCELSREQNFHLPNGVNTERRPAEFIATKNGYTFINISFTL
jgi:hypothetical protein